MKQGQESLVYYSFEKRSIFSRIKGKLGLKVYFVDEEAKAKSNPELIQIQSQEAANSNSPAEEKEENKSVAIEEGEQYAPRGAAFNAPSGCIRVVGCESVWHPTVRMHSRGALNAATHGAY